MAVRATSPRPPPLVRDLRCTSLRAAGWVLHRERILLVAGVVFLCRGLHPILHGGTAYHVDRRAHRKRDRGPGCRGELLPRVFAAEDLAPWGWAPLVNTVFFSLYHFFKPWLNVSRIIGLLPMVYGAWWKRSIYVSMTVHVLGNAIPMLFLLAGLLGTCPS